MPALRPVIVAAIVQDRAVVDGTRCLQTKQNQEARDAGTAILQKDSLSRTPPRSGRGNSSRCMGFIRENCPKMDGPASIVGG